jgi:hypothetical protein
MGGAAPAHLRSRVGSRSRASILGLLLAPLFSGCQIDPPKVHPRFAELRPSSILVPPIENRTVLDLSHVSSGGVLQRLTFGAQEVDVVATLREGFLLGLKKRGYGAVAGPVTASGGGTAGTACDAVLRSEITSFQELGGSSTPELAIDGKIELVKAGETAAGGGELLYQGSFHHRSGGPGAGARGPVDLDEEVRRAGLRAVLSIPPGPNPALLEGRR